VRSNHSVAVMFQGDVSNEIFIFSFITVFHWP